MISKKIILLCLVLCISVSIGCTSLIEGDRANKVREETLANMEEPLVVFYDGAGYYLLNSFMESHPEINIELVNCIPYVNEGLDFKSIVEKNGVPDLIIASEDVSGYLPQWHYEGLITDLGEFCSNDISINVENYFPEAFEAFRDNGTLYALPLGISMDFFVMSESKYDESFFSTLTDGYTGRELLNVMLEELNKEKEIDEFFCESGIAIQDFLYYLDGVKETADGIEMDQELFKQVYEIMYLRQKEADEAITYWNQQGKSFTYSEGFAFPGAIEPRRYGGKFTVSMGPFDQVPAVVLPYAETIYQYYNGEGIRAVYFPTADDGSKYQARVNVWGAVCGKSNRKQLAYELLRALMDEEIKSFGGISGLAPLGGSLHSRNIYPINIENAISLLEVFEKQTEDMVYGQWTSMTPLTDLTIVDRIDVSKDEKEKLKSMLRNISGLFYIGKNDSYDELADLFYDYYEANIFDYENCYYEMMNIINDNYAE